MTTIANLIREPLVHFLAIGLVIFAIDRAVSVEAEDPSVIRVDETVYARLARIYRDAHGDVPTAKDMQPLVDRYLMNETLYREALALSLDQGDEMMRSRLVQRMRQMIFKGVTVEDPEEDVLRAWVAEQGDTYDLKATVSFRVLGLDGAEEEARKLAVDATLREATGQPIKQPGLRMLTFSARPRDQLVEAFEEPFIAAIEAAEPNVWTPVESSRGWQVVQLLETTEPKSRPFEEIREVARTDWRKIEANRLANAALESLMRNYPPVLDDYDPAQTETYLDSIARRAETR